MSLTNSQRNAIETLWDELADFPAEKTDAAMFRCLETLARLVDAGNGYWLGSVRVGERHSGDPLHGWRSIVQHYLHPAPIHTKVIKEQVARWERREPDPSFLLTRKNEGRFRTILQRRDMPPAWFRSPHYRLYHGSRGIYDTAFVCFPVNEDVESWFAFQRVDARRRFTRADEELLVEALRPLKWFHRQLVLSYGMLLAEAPLTPAQRDVLRLLLTEDSEKEIAAKLGQSFHTTHRHVKDIFAKFGVRGRAGIMALWLGRGGASR